MITQFCNVNMHHPTHNELTHWDRDKMAAISQTTVSNAFSWMEMHKNSIKISLHFVAKDSIINTDA